MSGGDLDHVNWIPSKLGGLWMGPWRCSRERGLENALMILMTFLLSKGIGEVHRGHFGCS